MLGLERDAAEEIVSVDGGYALLSTSIPRVWDANLLVIDGPAPEVARIVELADELIGGAGMEHRTVIVSDRGAGAAVAPGFRALGWEVNSNLCMVLRRDPDRRGAVSTREARQVEIEDAYRPFIREDLPVEERSDDELIEQLLERDRRLGRVAGDRWFVADADRRPASFCRLFARDGIAQVEDVGTLAFARGRGLARSVVLAACVAAAADAAELTFLTARSDDWPRRFYARLGFDEVGLLHTFRRKPPALGA